MIDVICIGFGNVNQHLCRALQHSGRATIQQIYSLNMPQLPTDLKGIQCTDKLSELQEADLYLLGVPDDAIAAVSAQLPKVAGVVAHTSGSVALQQLSRHNKRGVFYPLQTFSRNRAVSLKDVPICIEAETEQDFALLQTIGEVISSQVVAISSEKRRALHLAAVYVNNFVNHLYHISYDLIATHGLDAELLSPLILETAKKAIALSPLEAQTGPARRNDKKTLEKQLHLLPDGTAKKLYELFTQSIQATYGKKL
jgi:predicted short-subunit dehydrogenase-like oxidoreductase (DUF2520 family)